MFDLMEGVHVISVTGSSPLSMALLYISVAVMIGSIVSIIIEVIAESDGFGYFLSAILILGAISVLFCASAGYGKVTYCVKIDETVNINSVTEKYNIKNQDDGYYYLTEREDKQ